MPSYISSVAVSPTGVYLAFGDAEGNINVMSAAEEGSSIPFNGFEGQPIEWADPPEALPEIEWTDTTCGHPPLTLPMLTDARRQSTEQHRHALLRHSSAVVLDVQVPLAQHSFSTSAQDSATDPQYDEV